MITGVKLAGIHHAARVFDLDEATERWSRQFGLTVRERRRPRLSRARVRGLRGRADPVGRAARLRPRRLGARAGRDLGRPRRRGRGAARRPRALASPGRSGRLRRRARPLDGARERLSRRRPPLDRLPAFHPTKLGHVNVLTQDVKRLPRSTSTSSAPAHGPTRRRGDLAAPERRPPRPRDAREGRDPLPPLRAGTARHRRGAAAARPPRQARPLGDLGPGPPRRRGVDLRLHPDPGGGSDRRALLRHGAAAPITSRATGRTRRIPRTPGARCRRGRTSASTPRRSRPMRGQLQALGRAPG